jgi:hypothetical protein
MTIINTVAFSNIKQLSVSARCWFQKSYGNTYHSMRLSAVVSRDVANRLYPLDYPLNGNNGDVWIDLAYVDFEYGYGDHYRNTAMKALIEATTDRPDWLTTANYYHIDRAAEKAGILYDDECCNVQRKKDL